MSVRSPAQAATSAAVRDAAGLIRRGRLVAFPTETVYGLGADATDDRAVAAVFMAKNRPRFNPLIVHITDTSAAEAFCVMEDRARGLADRFWPGPLTLVLPRRKDARLSLLVSAGLETVAVRAPDHAVARDLLIACGRPIAAPSANPSGSVSPTTAEHVAAGLGDRVAMILDGGPCRLGLESTVVDLTGAQPVLLRPGGLPAEELEAVLGPLPSRLLGPRPGGGGGVGDDAPRSPGMLMRHYAPSKPVRMDVEQPRPGEALLGFGPHGSNRATLNLSPGGDLVEAAANLFAMLRRLDQGRWSGIAVMPVPERSLGRAINDRLRRAAAATAEPPGAASTHGDGDWDDRGPAAPCVLPDLEEES